MSQADRTRQAPVGCAPGATSVPGVAVSSAAASNASCGLPFGPLRRDPDGAALTGVCSVSAQHWGIDPLLVRAVAVITGLSGGFGVVLYAGLWSMTPERGSDAAPLDRLLPQWRSWTSKAQWGTLLAVSALFALTAGSLTPLGCGPSAVIVLLTWYASRSRLRQASPAAQRLTAPPIPEPAPGHPRTRTRLPELMATPVTLLAAALGATAVWWGLPGMADVHRTTLTASAGLLIVAIGLLLRVRRGGSLTLVITGAALSAAILAPLLPPPELPATTRSYLTTTDLPPGPVTVTARSSRLDFSDLTISADTRIEIVATAADLVVLLPKSVNVEITGEFKASTITMPDGHKAPLTRTGASWGPKDHPGAPTLHIILTATAASVRLQQ